MSCLRPRTRSMALGFLVILTGLVAMPTPTRGQSEAESLSASFRKAARRALPAVVSIRPLTPPAPPFGPALPPLVFDPILPPPSFPGPRVAGGSGVVVDAGRGLVLTNDHVLGDGSPVIVVLGDGRERPVSRVDRDPKSDLALLTLADPLGLVQAEWGDSETIDIGDWVLAIGQPFGLSGTVTAGIVSGKGRGIGVALYEDLIQTDASINPGNSGGPLVNLRSEIVGINTAIKTAGGGYEGVGFALPSARARRVAADLAAFGRVRRAYLGINIRKVDPPTAEQVGRSDAAMVFGVVQGSPADQAGLRPGDVITGLDGKPIGMSALQTAIEVAAVGEPLKLTIHRDGSGQIITVRPATQPDRFGLSGPDPGPLPDVIEPRPRAGEGEPSLNLEPPAPANRPDSVTLQVGPKSMALADLGLTLAEAGPGGLLVEKVESDGPADRGGLEVGMRITEIKSHPIRTLEDLRVVESRRTPTEDVRVGIARGTKTGVRVIPPPLGGTQEVLEPIPPASSPRELPASAPALEPRPES